MDATNIPSAAAIAEAKRQGTGWVYKVEGDFGNNAVPREAIVGAWKVEGGVIVGEFIPNPNHVPKSKK
jgi:hypothetical protein